MMHVTYPVVTSVTLLQPTENKSASRRNGLRDICDNVIGPGCANVTNPGSKPGIDKLT